MAFSLKYLRTTCLVLALGNVTFASINQNGGHDEVVVVIEPDLRLKGISAPNLIERISQLFNSSSFKTIIFLVPPDWDEEVSQKSWYDFYDFNDADVQVENPSALHGDRPYTSPVDDYRHPGQRLHLPVDFLTKPDKSSLEFFQRWLSAKSGDRTETQTKVKLIKQPKDFGVIVNSKAADDLAQSLNNSIERLQKVIGAGLQTHFVTCADRMEIAEARNGTKESYDRCVVKEVTKVAQETGARHVILVDGGLTAEESNRILEGVGERNLKTHLITRRRKTRNQTKWKHQTYTIEGGHFSKVIPQLQQVLLSIWNRNRLPLLYADFQTESNGYEVRRTASNSALDSFLVTLRPPVIQNEGADDLRLSTQTKSPFYVTEFVPQAGLAIKVRNPYYLYVKISKVPEGLEMRVWTDLDNRRLAGGNVPMSVSVQMTYRGLPVLNADLQAIIQDGRIKSSVTLTDDGKSNPDVTGNDGIYSGYYFRDYKAGQELDIAIKVLGGDGMSVGEKMSSVDQRHAIEKSRPFSTGSFEVPFGKFSGRYSISSKTFPPSRIEDLRVLNGTLLAWTAPGGYYHEGKPKSYYIACTKNADELRKDLVVWTRIRPATQKKLKTFELTGRDDGIIFCAVRAKNRRNIMGKPSDIIPVPSIGQGSSTTEQRQTTPHSKRADDRNITVKCADDRDITAKSEDNQETTAIVSSASVVVFLIVVASIICCCRKKSGKEPIEKKISPNDESKQAFLYSFKNTDTTDQEICQEAVLWRSAGDPQERLEQKRIGR